MKKAGATNLMMLDPHTPQVEGFFDLIVDTLRVLFFALTHKFKRSCRPLCEAQWKVLYKLSLCSTLGGTLVLRMGPSPRA